MFEKNKRGADKILSIYWFAILIIVAGGVVGMVLVFYDHPYDVREVEADILTNKVVDCLSYGGELDTSFFVEGKVSNGLKENFLELCKISFEVEDIWKDEPQYYLSIEVYSVNNLNDFLFNFEEGNLNLVSYCELQENEEHDRLAKCNEKRLYTLSTGGQYLIKILGVVKKSEKNVA